MDKSSARRQMSLHSYSKSLHKRIHSYDSEGLSEGDFTKSTMSSGSSVEHPATRQNSWSSLAQSFSDSHTSARVSAVDYSTGGSSKSCSSRQTSSLHEVERADDQLLPDITQLPWTETDLLLALRESRANAFCDNLSIECLHRLSYLLHRPLVRIVREAKRLSVNLDKCTQTEVQYACRIILSRKLYESCHNSACKAIILYSVSPMNCASSKSSQCGLHLPVGKHFRWMLEARTAGYIHELAAVYLTAIMESLCEQTMLNCLTRHDLEKSVITTDMLEAGIQSHVDYFSIFHYTDHLKSGRNAMDCLTDSILSPAMRASLNPTLCKALESNLLTSCVGSISELGHIINQAMCQWFNKPSRAGEMDRSVKLAWGTPALKALFYYMQCNDIDCCSGDRPASIILEADRLNLISHRPSLTEWIRVAAAFADYRHDVVISSDDVLQAARVLLPNCSCPPSSSWIQSPTSDTSTKIQDYIEQEKESLAYKLLAMSRTDAIEEIVSLLGLEGVNKINKQGLTPLMFASHRGDDSMVQCLIQAGADLEVRVPGPSDKYRAVQQTCAGWTALHFAVTAGKINTVKLLLDSGCTPDGKTSSNCDTPLQIATAKGDCGSTSLLLNKLSDPYLLTSFRPLTTAEKGFSLNAFTLAASHGHREILRRLFSVPLNQKSATYLSLSEILSEMSGEVNSNSLQHESHIRDQAEKEENENIYMVIENDYITVHDTQNELLCSKLTASQIATLQDALYHSAENGFLDITLEVQAMGISWTLYTWYKSLENAFALQRRSVIQNLLSQFFKLDYNNIMFTTTVLPLMFNIFTLVKNETVTQQLAAIFSHIYGSQPVPLLKEITYKPSLTINESYINSPDMSDVCFLVEQNKFYAHKIVLASASNRFKEIFSSLSDCNEPEIQISDISYPTFEHMMKYVYTGQISTSGEHKSIRSLHSAAHYFQLNGLQRKCEILLSKCLNTDNCLSIYRSAKQYEAAELMEICEAFFLQNLASLLKSSAQFKRIINSTKYHNKELLNRLSAALERRLNSRNSLSTAC